MALPDRRERETFAYADRKRKFSLYEKYGVTEYWIVDIDEQVLELYHRDAGSTTFRRVDAYGRQDTVTSIAIAKISVELERVFPARDGES